MWAIGLKDTDYSRQRESDPYVVVIPMSVSGQDMKTKTSSIRMHTFYCRYMLPNLIKKIKQVIMSRIQVGEIYFHLMVHKLIE